MLTTILIVIGAGLIILIKVIIISKIDIKEKEKSSTKKGLQKDNCPL